MKKVLGFDSWTGGSRHFSRLVPALKARGMSLQLLHLGSWGSDRGRPLEEMIDGLLVRDISSFPGKSFREIIDSEKPDAVVFLWVDTFAHRAFLRYCTYKGIPTLNLYHGLVKVMEVGSGRPIKTGLLAQLNFIRPRLIKAFTKVWPAYIGALIFTKAAFSEWIWFMKDAYDFAANRFTVVAAPDARTDRCAVYTQADVQHAVKKYGFDATEVSAVGNPDMIAFRLSPDVIGYGLSRGKEHEPEIVYVDTGFVYHGSAFKNAGEFLEYILLTKRGLEKQGLRLSVKLHPQHYITDLPARLSAAGVELINNEEFVHRVKACSASIVEPSTAAMIPAMVGVPLFLASYDKLSGQKYGEVLISYPRAIMLEDLGKVSRLLQQEQGACDPTKVMEWINENTGPLPAEQMPERVADIISEMIQDR